MDEDSDLARAIAEYSNPTTSYSALEDYLMQRPVFDRGPREAVNLPSLRRLDAPMPTETQADRFSDLIAEQRALDTADRQSEIDNLRDLLREELASSEDAARAERSDVTKALEGRIDELRRGIDAETLDLRQAGLDERAALARQIEEGDKIVREAQELSVSNLQDRLFSLSDDLANINSAIDQNYEQLTESQKATADSTQTEIDGLNQQLESLYDDVESGQAAASDSIRADTAKLIEGLENRIGGVADNLASLPIETIQSELASVSTQAAQFQQAMDAATSERAELSSRIAALQDAGLTQEDLAAAISPIEQQRQQAISAAVSPLQKQIADLQQAVPAEVDTDALRQQIKDEILASLPEATPTTTTPAASLPGASVATPGVGSGEGNLMDYQGPSFGETPDSFGFNAPASLNMSDGRADALGVFDDPAGTEVVAGVPLTVTLPAGGSNDDPAGPGDRGPNPAVGRRPDGSIITLLDTQTNPIDFELAFGKPANEKTPRATPPPPPSGNVGIMPVPDDRLVEAPRLPGVID
tara:strand:- start:7462 stop:9051 length:1590 start_codon:yes stop_codon:yes gene_type:complete